MSVCDDYSKLFYAYDGYNKQIKHRVWPHRDGGNGRLGEAGKHNSFMFGCIIENTVNAYRHIMNVDSEDFEYFGYCQTLANDLYVYASTLSDSTI